MEIHSLQNLKRNGRVYELYTQVIVNGARYGIYSFPLTDRHTMRIDLVCVDIYKNTENIDILCSLNSLYQPLSIQEGDVIFWIEEKDIQNARSNENVLQALINSVTAANTGKDTKQDTNRIADTANRSQTEKDKKLPPPNIVQTPNGNIDLTEGAIILKPNF